ncbi:MAG TPA: hypothetical protein VFQ63_01530 [Patescibacteria group bacterium]|nr:hypothetical protein [Patescibacteria group bacterium]
MAINVDSEPPFSGLSLEDRTGIPVVPIPHHETGLAGLWHRHAPLTTEGTIRLSEEGTLATLTAGLFGLASLNVDKWTLWLFQQGGAMENVANFVTSHQEFLTVPNAVFGLLGLALLGIAGRRVVTDVLPQRQTPQE